MWSRAVHLAATARRRITRPQHTIASHFFMGKKKKCVCCRHVVRKLQAKWRFGDGGAGPTRIQDCVAGRGINCLIFFQGPVQLSVERHFHFFRSPNLCYIGAGRPFFFTHVLECYLCCMEDRDLIPSLAGTIFYTGMLSQRSLDSP